MGGFHTVRMLLVVGVVSTIVSGCQARPEIFVDPALNADNAGEIFVYRPSSEWLGLAIDQRVMLDGNYIGSLEAGEYVQCYAAPGKHEIVVQPYFLSFPDDKPAIVTVTAEIGRTHYVRFSQHLDEFIVTGTIPMASGHVELELVPYEVWAQRE